LWWSSVPDSGEPALDLDVGARRGRGMAGWAIKPPKSVLAKGGRGDRRAGFAAPLGVLGRERRRAFWG
jgi:hypothetical protein